MKREDIQLVLGCWHLALTAALLGIGYFIRDMHPPLGLVALSIVVWMAVSMWVGWVATSHDAQ